VPHGFLQGERGAQHPPPYAAHTKFESAGVPLNPDKCEFVKCSITFLGHVIDQEGVSACPGKTKAVVDMSQPINATDTRRFLSWVNQLGKFSSKLADHSQPLRELLSKDQSWLWRPPQESSLKAVKAELAKSTVVALYSATVPIKISADASVYRLGATIIYCNDMRNTGSWSPLHLDPSMTPRTLLTDRKRNFSFGVGVCKVW
jgi:hypothetical protein